MNLSNHLKINIGNTIENFLLIINELNYCDSEWICDFQKVKRPWIILYLW